MTGQRGRRSFPTQSIKTQLVSKEEKGTQRTKITIHTAQQLVCWISLNSAPVFANVSIEPSQNVTVLIGRAFNLWTHKELACKGRATELQQEQLAEIQFKGHWPFESWLSDRHWPEPRLTHSVFGHARAHRHANVRTSECTQGRYKVTIDWKKVDSKSPGEVSNSAVHFLPPAPALSS